MERSNPQKKLLLLGGSHAEIPLIQAAHELGWYVITTGNNRDGLGHPYADKTVFADFSDKNAMLELASNEGVQAVCSGCNDFALLSTVYVCGKLGLPGHDSYATSLELHHKDKYRALAARLDIPTPRALVVRNAADFETAISQLTFPIIVKPVDLTGGKGIHRAANADEARDAYKDACSRTREDHVVVEEFVTGTNHGFSAMLVKGKVAFAFSDNEQYYLNKYMVSGANTPSTTSAAGLAKLRDYSERIARELHLVDGILHIQYIESPSSETTANASPANYTSSMAFCISNTSSVLTARQSSLRYVADRQEICTSNSSNTPPESTTQNSS